MKKRFIVALDSNTKAQNDEFKDYIKKSGYGWWSWIDGFWLLTDSTGNLSAAKLRSDLGEIYSGIDKLVIELREGNDTWAGFGPSNDKKNMFKWLKNNW